MYVKCYLSVGTMFKEPIPSVYIGSRMIWKNTDIFLQEFRLIIELQITEKRLSSFPSFSYMRLISRRWSVVEAMKG